MDHNKKNSRGRRVWGKKIEYIFSLLGYSTGTSDFWRFPYLFWKNGGVSFLIPFVLALIVCAIPLFYLEVVVSQYSGRGMLKTWDICPLFKGIGYAMFVINLVSIVYIATIRIWVMEYIVYSVVSDVPWITCGNEWNTDACVASIQTTNITSLTNVTSYAFLKTNMSNYNISTIEKKPVSPEEEFWLYKILAISSGVDDFGTIRWEMALGSLVLRILLFLCVIKSVQSVGKVVYVTSTLPIIFFMIIWIQALTLNGSTEGLIFFLKPKIELLLNPTIWMEASVAAIFTISVGYGGIPEIASHGKFRSNCLSSVVTLVSIDVLGSVFISMVLFSVLGVMAAEMGTPVNHVITGGTSVTFVGITKAFSFLPVPKLWSIVFFIAVFIAIVDFMILCTETVVSSLKHWNSFLRKRHLTTLILFSVFAFITTLPFCTQAGPYWYHLIDWFLSSWSVQLILLIECVVFMWIYGGDRVNTFVQSMNETSIPHLFRFLAAYICPLIYILFLILSTVHFKPPIFGSYVYPPAAEALGWFFAVFPSIPIFFFVIRPMIGRKGSLKKRLLELTKPVVDFGPADVSCRDAYLLNLKDSRTLKDLAYFNATGLTRRKQKENVVEMFSEEEHLASEN